MPTSLTANSSIMQQLARLMALSLALAAVGHAAPAKKVSKDPAFADTWAANAKTYAGKKITTSILEMGEIGAIPGNAPCAVLSVSTGNTKGEEGGPVLILLPAKDVEAFVKNATKAKKAPAGSFGAKITYPVVTGTYAVVEGEGVLVVGETPKLGGKKPTELLDSQRAAGAGEKASPGTTAEEAHPVDTRPKKKPVR